MKNFPALLDKEQRGEGRMLCFYYCFCTHKSNKGKSKVFLWGGTTHHLFVVQYSIEHQVIYPTILYREHSPYVS